MSWVDARIFAGGGAYIAENWEQFEQDTGIQAVLELTSAAAIDFGDRQPERYLHIPVTREAEAGLEERIQAGRFVAEAVYSARRVLLYAERRRHTRWAYVAFLLYRGEKLARALGKAEETPWMEDYVTDQARWMDFCHFLHTSQT